MPAASDANNSVDPTELWKRWNETTSRMWSSVLESSKGAYSDPFGFSDLWMKSIGVAQEQAKVGIPDSFDATEIWKQWVDATTDAWKRAAEAGKDAVALSGQWMRVLEETRAKLLSGEINSKDPITFFKQWYDATSETWAQVVGEVMSSERFLQAQRQFIEAYTSAVRASNRLNEELFQTMQLPTRSDIARVAGLVVSLEEKFDTIEDAFEGFEERFARTGASKAVGDDRLEKRLQQIEHKLDSLLAALEDQAKTPPEAGQPGAGTRRKTQTKQV